MRYNDLKTKVTGKFYKEITIEGNEDDVTYIFPDTKEFISILKRNVNKKAAKKI
jgi:hypothetical protein